ncbi:SAM-dependent methyltransferase [Agromyces cerinus]|uniref:class I SAM-dependent methyltransferase n=1 Tax=Agromyces cerinus TaxID=33878 RepID=UPI00195DC7AD|nr:class I SAM-dependent methyltransferase [Agromyces cerinus]MBM7830043.1 SAM-dependent methyltransferase [Agromyces cerinus]
MTLFRRRARHSTLRVMRKGLRVRFDSPAIGRTVGVEVDGHRMWTVAVPETAHRTTLVPWPAVLRNHLSGAGDVVLRDQNNGAVLARGRFAWPSPEASIGVADLARGGQVVDKWGKLTDAPSDALHRRLMAAMREVLDDLQELGYTVAITGGTLLGAVREGRILAHDDDVDLLVYLGRIAPPDVSIASYALERSIRSRGHEVIRHSDAHLQVLFGDEDSEAHVDLFLGFHDRGLYNQPIAVRGGFPVESLLPLSEQRLEGVAVPSVADAEGWLALCYGEGWSTPDPAFRFDTRAPTRRRFENWFGVYDFNRDFWERHTRLGRSQPWWGDAKRMLAMTRRGDRILDLGCGDGALAEELAGAGRQVLAADYSRRALAEASDRPGVSAQRLNLADRRAVLDFVADELRDDRHRHVFLSNVLASVTKETRANVFLMLRALLDSGSVALASFPVNASLVYDHHRPDTWHLPVKWLREEASAYGLVCVVESRRVRSTSAGPRTVARVRIYSTRGAARAVQEEAR